MNFNFFPISYWFELLSLVVCIYHLNRLKGSSLILFLPLLLCVVVGEFIGIYLSFINTDNSFLYNLLTIIQFTFWYIIFYKNFKTISPKRLTKYLGIIFLLFAFFNLFFFQSFFYFNNYTLIVGAFITILLCCLMFYQILNDKSVINPISYPFFWITSGAFFFFTGTFFYFSLYNSLQKLQAENNTLIFNLIILNLNILFYSLISVGLILHKKGNK